MSSSISASSRSRSRQALSSGARRGLLLIAIFAIVGVFAYPLAWVFQLGNERQADWWLREIMVVRDGFYRERMAQIPPNQSKVLVVGGSSTLFGVNSEQIEKLTGAPTFNLGLHAGLDIDLVLAAADQYVQPGDRVVLPLEFEYYKRPLPTELTPRDFRAFFYKYADRMPTSSLIQFLRATPALPTLWSAAKRIVDLLSGKSKPPPARDEATILAERELVRKTLNPDKRNAYDMTTLSNGYGDKEVPQNADKSRLAEFAVPHSPILPNPIVPYALQHLELWKDSITKQRASFILTWPVLLEDSQGSFFTEEYWSRIISSAKLLSASGLPLHCDPIRAIVPKQYRFDSVYHVNVKGQEIYSTGLADCIENIEQKPFNFQTARPADLARRARQWVDSFQVPPDPLMFGYERNLRRLATLNAEIDAARSRDGRFPLLPPTDIAADNRLWYRSDGNDYKLLIEDPAECYVAALAAPDRIDPVRGSGVDCKAYGYWSAGAASW